MRGCRWGMLVVIVVMSSLLVTRADGGATLHVDDDALPGGDGTSWAMAYTHLQDALSAAALGGVTSIRIAQGVQRPDRSATAPAGTGDPAATFMLLDGVDLHGGFAGIGAIDPDANDPALYETVLTGDDVLMHVLSATTGNPVSSVTGCTVRDGAAFGAMPADRSGAGLTASNGVITFEACRFTGHAASGQGAAIKITGGAVVIATACVFEGNTSSRGGAVDVGAGVLTANGTVFEMNTSTGLGGALYSDAFSTTELVDVRFEGNHAATGGGAWRVASNAAATATNCSFIGNSSSAAGGAVTITSSDVLLSACTFISNMSDTDGGALAVLFFVEPTVERCIFRDNSAEDGGAIVLNGFADVAMRSCIIENNTASMHGGGVFFTELSTPVFTNCVITGNHAGMDGGAMRGNFEAHAILINCTIARNHADGSTGGIRCFNTSFSTMTNTILHENTDGVTTGEAAQITSDGAPITMASCSVEGWTGALGGTNNSNAAPLFKVFPRLSVCSPLIDAGTNAVAPDVGAVDLDGHPRFVDQPTVTDTGVGSARIVDLGAYEFTATPCPADVRPFSTPAAQIGNGVVNVDDLLAVINAFAMRGDLVEDVAPGCGNGVINIDDLLEVINAFGACR